MFSYMFQMHHLFALCASEHKVAYNRKPSSSNQEIQYNVKGFILSTDQSVDTHTGQEVKQANWAAIRISGESIDLICCNISQIYHLQW